MMESQIALDAEVCAERQFPYLESLQGSENIRALLQELLSTLQNECAAASARHQDLASKLLTQHHVCNQQLSDIDSRLSALTPTVPFVPGPARIAPAAPFAPEAPVAPETEGSPSASDRDPREEQPLSKTELEANISPSLHAGLDRQGSTLSDMTHTITSQSARATKVAHTISMNSDFARHSELSSHLHISRRIPLSTYAKAVLEQRSWAALNALLEAVVSHNKFEASIAALIMANAVVLCFEVQYSGIQVGYKLNYGGFDSDASTVWPAAPTLFQMFDWIFGFMYLAEAAVKITGYGRRYFLDVWNWLDFSCVLIFLAEKLAAQVITFDTKAIRLLRFLRLMRLIRAVRTMESFDQLYIMTTAISGMFMVVLWAVMLLSVILMAESLFLTQLLHASYFKDTSADNLSEESLASQQKFFEYFGSFTRCYLSMFELTLANWPPVSRMLTEEVTEWFMPFCLLHKLSVGFAFVGVINGVVLQETFKVASTDDWIMVRQKKMAYDVMKKKMTALFSALDVDMSGQLEWDEFCVIAEIPEIKIWLSSLDIDTHDLGTLFTLLDQNNNGAISLNEFLARIHRVKGVARSIDLLKLKKDVKDLGHTSIPDGRPHADTKTRVASMRDLKINDVTLAGTLAPAPLGQCLGKGSLLDAEASEEKFHANSIISCAMVGVGENSEEIKECRPIVEHTETTNLQQQLKADAEHLKIVNANQCRYRNSAAR